MSHDRARFLALAVGVALGALTPCFGAAPVGDSATALDSALQKLQSGDADGAASSLALIVEHDPENARAWRALGSAQHLLHAYDKAIAAFERALQLDADSPQVLYNVGRSYAARGDGDRAFEWLARARASRRIDMTQISQDADLAKLRDDARFNNLLPDPADFEHPFTESITILKEWRGQASDDQFGWIARNIGDVDKDGVNDVVTSAPTHGSSSSKAGAIYVYSTRSGKLLWTAKGAAGDELGTGVEAAGDTNRDGVTDVVASGPAGAGVAFIYSGNDGGVLQRFASTNAEESFGSHASGAGDVDQDGFADVIVGAPGKEGESKVPGRAYVYSGRDGKRLFAFAGEQVGDGFGSTVAGRSDGVHRFLIIGAPRAGPQHRGRVYVFDRLSQRSAFTIEADATGKALGQMFVSAPGDMDGDGVTEIYASDWGNAASGPSTGRVYVHSGATGRRLLTLTGETAGEGFGTSPSMAGDVNGDGRADLIVGAWQYGKAALSAGRAYLYSGLDGSLIRTYTCRIPGDTFGFDAVGMGDIDGDGTVDLLITSAWSGVSGFHSGRVLIISSGVQRAKDDSRPSR